MLTVEQKPHSEKALRVTVALIVLAWIFAIVNPLFGAGSIYNIFAH